MPPAKILVVDDEARIVAFVKAYLEREGYAVITAADGPNALKLAREQQPQLIVLDLMLPEISGWDVCRTLRRESSVPIIMLTARDEVADKIVGLELGADDYVTKPFDPKELVSRVNAVLRRARGGGPPGAVISVDDLVIDPDKHQVRRAGEPVELTAMEFAMLQTLAQSPGRVFSRAQLLDRVQGEDFVGYDRTIDSHIKNLRRKLEPDPDNPRYIITVYGVGYKMEERRA